MTTFTEPVAPDGARIVGEEQFRTDGTAVALRATRCRGCASVWFPHRAQCSDCASGDVDQFLTSAIGVSYASTIVRVGPKDFPAPYTLAYVDIDGARVLAHVASADAVPPGTRVRLVLARIGADKDGPLLSYAVVPATQGELR